MSKFLGKVNHSFHNLSCMALNLSEPAEVNNLFYVQNVCMADKLSLTNSIILNNEALGLINEIRLKQYQTQKNQIESQLNKFQIIIRKIQSYMDWQNNYLNQLLTQSNSAFKKYQIELKLLSDSKFEELEKSDLELIYQMFNRQNSVINSQQANQDKFKEFMESIQLTIEQIKVDEKFQEIIKCLDEIVCLQIQEGQVIIKSEIKLDEKVQDTQIELRPYLDQVFSKYGKEINMKEKEFLSLIAFQFVMKSQLLLKKQIWIILKERYATNNIYLMLQGNKNNLKCQRSFKNIKKVHNVY